MVAATMQSLGQKPHSPLGSGVSSDVAADRINLTSLFPLPAVIRWLTLLPPDLNLVNPHITTVQNIVFLSIADCMGP
ncbi:MAG: hypothetical protein PHO37_02935 [Kiritimatiellae bacterium]|nr:hypothetical protein [Kiritimatiellia bacterium]